jgi:hypothetical protein
VRDKTNAWVQVELQLIAGNKYYASQGVNQHGRLSYLGDLIPAIYLLMDLLLFTARLKSITKVFR